jgi:hypothetical protein
VIIRTAQIEAFERAAVSAFEDRTYAHLQDFFPHHCKLLGEDQMRRVIKRGWEKSKSYDLTAECCVRSYIDLMCILGGGFDSDTLLPWAVEILNDKSSTDQLARGDRLYHKAWDYVDHIAADYRDVSGRPTTARFLPDLRELRYGNDEVITDSGMPQFLKSLQLRFKRLFPAKCDYVGDGNLSKVVLTGVESANTYGITAERGAILFVSMRFILGSGFDKDLLLPWASAALLDRAIPDQYKRVDKLYADGVSFLRQWWNSSSGKEDHVLG